jgi:alkylation response protein AidB-like acyl-CoA dehydrogenase
VHEELGRTITLHPAARFAQPAHADDHRQPQRNKRERYLAPYVRGETVSAIAISEPGAGGDPAGMKSTRAERDGDDWVINGRKIWISRAEEGRLHHRDGLTDREKGSRGGISAFIVDKGTPGFNVAAPHSDAGRALHLRGLVRGLPGPRQASCWAKKARASRPCRRGCPARRVQMAAWCIGRAQRALDMMVRVRTAALDLRRAAVGAPGDPVVDRRRRDPHPRLPADDLRGRLAHRSRREARTQVSMIKAFATEMAWEIIDHAMQTFGAMGMTKELPLQQMANDVRG